MDEQGARSRGLRFLKSYVEFGIKLARVNFAGTEQDGFGPSVRSSKLPLWSRAAEIYFYYFTTKLIASCLLQHNYYQANQEFKALNATACDETSDLWPVRQQKAAELARAVQLAKILEHPFYELGPPNEIVTILTLITMFHCYVEVRIYNHLYGPIRVGAVRLFLNPKLERELMLKNELGPLIKSFAGSTVNYLAASKDRMARSHQAPAQSAESIMTSRGLRELRLCQIGNVELLRDMAAGGELDPPNRRPEWTRRLALVYGARVLIFLTGGNMMGAFMMIALPLSGKLAIELHYGWRGILFTLEGLVFCALYVQWIHFPIVLISMATLDHLAFAKALKRTVSNLTDDVGALNQSSNLTSSFPTRRLLRALIQYRLFKQQLCSSQNLVGLVSGNMISLMLLAPALARVYASQLSAEVRYMYIMYCLLTILSVDMLILPTCSLHARCLELYRAMSYLLSNLDAVNHFNQVDPISDARIDQHTLGLLRRELHQPEFATEQFATDAHIMRLTYGNLMRVHFYCGLWLVPMFMRDTSSLGSATSDLLDIL